MTEFLSRNKSLQISKTFFSNDGSVKYVLSTEDNRKIEAIYFPFEGNFGGKKISANVICLSSQVGCPIRCSFCETRRMENPRNLSKEELILQLNLITSNLESNNRRPVDSVAMMGMGEPLLNLNNVLEFYDAAKERPNPVS